jgi:hypothetical protein
MHKNGRFFFSMNPWDKQQGGIQDDDVFFN